MKRSINIGPHSVESIDSSEIEEDIVEVVEPSTKFKNVVTELTDHGSLECNTYVVGIDPGSCNLGVCVYHVESDTVLHLIEFNLNDFIPDKDKECISSHGTKKATTTNFGLCIWNLVSKHKDIFIPSCNEKFSRSKIYVGIEQQMNESPDNCCILSSFQMYYKMNGENCFVLSTRNLNNCFPRYFMGTERNRTLRKRRIRELGYMLLREEERFNCMEYQKNNIDDPILPGSRKRGRQKPSEHALDAMFYAFCICLRHENIKVNVLEERESKNSNLTYNLNQIFKSQVSDLLNAEDEESEDFTESVKKAMKKRKNGSVNKRGYNSYTKKRFCKRKGK